MEGCLSPSHPAPSHRLPASAAAVEPYLHEWRMHRNSRRQYTRIVDVRHTVVRPVGDHGKLLRPGITPGLVHGLVELQTLCSFALDMQPGKLLDDDVGGARATLELLSAACSEAVLAECRCELALSDFAFSSRSSTHHTLHGELGV